MPAWLSKFLVLICSAAAVPVSMAGGEWLLAHPIPDSAMMPALLLLGLSGLVYGARKGR